MERILVGRLRCATLWCDLGVAFGLDSARIISLSHLRPITLITKPCGLLQLIIIFIYLFNLIVLFLLTPILLLINRSVYKFYSFITFTLQIDAVILLLSF